MKRLSAFSCSCLLACLAFAPTTAASQSPDAATIEYIAHAAFLIRSTGGSEVLIDPYASRVWLGYDFPEGVDPDAVIITHPHYDHDGGRFRGRELWWDDTMTVIDAPGRHTVGDIVVHGVEGKHADPYGMEFGQRNTIMIIEVAGLRIAHVGDNGPLTEVNVRDMGRVDVLMLPIDGVEHILSNEAVEAAIEAVAPRIVVPMHYRIPELETANDSPSDLGEIDPWLVDRDRVVRLDDNRHDLVASDLPAEQTVLVFRHHPDLRPYAPGRIDPLLGPATRVNQGEGMTDAIRDALAPGPEHVLLSRLVGTWDVRGTSGRNATPVEQVARVEAILGGTWFQYSLFDGDERQRLALLGFDGYRGNYAMWEVGRGFTSAQPRVGEADGDTLRLRRRYTIRRRGELTEVREEVTVEFLADGTIRWRSEETIGRGDPAVQRDVVLTPRRVPHPEA